MNLVELQNKIHQQNRELGWWDEERPFSTFVCLFHSELSEAMEGDRKGLMDDHLPQYPMVAVEVADFVIRVLDWFGAQEDIDVNEITPWRKLNLEVTDYIADMHQNVSAAYYFTGVYGGLDSVESEMQAAVSTAFEMAYNFDWDLWKIINEKVEYNKHRADHKRENRAKSGGKKY